MQHKHLIVKRRGHTEAFDIKKLYASLYAACRSIRMSEPESEMLADKISREIEKSIEKAQAVSSNEIFRLGEKHLSAHNPEAAYMYKHHRDIS